MFFAKLRSALLTELSTRPNLPTQSNDLVAAGRAEIRAIEREE